MVFPGDTGKHACPTGMGFPVGFEIVVRRLAPTPKSRGLMPNAL